MTKKIIIVGNYKWDFYEKALIDGFKSINIKAEKYIIESLSLTYKLLNFRKINQLNAIFLQEMVRQKPDAIFFYRTNEIFPKTLKTLKRKLPQLKLLMYHNDNPFFGLNNRIKYNSYLQCLKEVDITYVYRPSNIKDAKKYGAKNVKLFFPYYYTNLHLNKTINYQQKKNDVVFVGHFEKHRADYINALIQNGIKVKIFGEGWVKVSIKYNWDARILNEPVYGADYNKTLSNAKIALCFLSKKNNDVYTRRNFEIPAIGTAVVSQYTKELTQLFEPNKEIILFKDKLELVDKVKKYLKDKKLLYVLTKNSHQKIIASNHSQKDRAKQIINSLLPHAK